MASKPTTAAAPVSPPWKIYTVESTGKKYWYNKTTKEKSWTDPTLPAKSAAKDPVPKTTPAVAEKGKDTAAKAPAALGISVWEEYTAGDKKYWYNNNTKEKSWKDPNAMAKSVANEAVAKPKTTVPPAETSAAPSTAVAKDKALPAAAAASGAGDSKVVKATTSTTPATPATPSTGNNAGSGTPHQPAASSAPPYAPAPAAESSREIHAVVAGHGATPDEHATDEVKSKKKNWRGALDVGLKVLDSAMERAKKGENFTKHAGHDAPVIKSPISAMAHHAAPTEASKEASHTTSKGQDSPKATPAKGSKAPDTHASKDSSSHYAAKDAPRPKAASKLSWKSPFKKGTASSPPTAHEEKRNIGADDEDERAGTAPSSYAAAAAMPAAALSQPARAPQSGPPGLPSSQDDGDNDDRYRPDQNAASKGGAASGQKSQIRQDTAAAGVGALGGGAGYGAYNEYEGASGNESSPPSPPPEQDHSAPPSPPVEQDVDNGSGPPSPPLDQDVDNDSGPPSPPANHAAGYTTYAFEQPPSPSPTSPPQDGHDNFNSLPSSGLKDDSDNDAAPPNPAQSASPPTPGSPAPEDGDDDNQAAPSPASPASLSPPASPAPANDSDDDG